MIIGFLDNTLSGEVTIVSPHRYGASPFDHAPQIKKEGLHNQTKMCEWQIMDT